MRAAAAATGTLTIISALVVVLVNLSTVTQAQLLTTTSYVPLPNRTTRAPSQTTRNPVFTTTTTTKAVRTNCAATLLAGTGRLAGKCIKNRIKNGVKFIIDGELKVDKDFVKTKRMGAKNPPGTKSSDSPTSGVSAEPPAAASSSSGVSAPASFDVHAEYPECQPVPLNQGECGSCWAFASTGTVAQRQCLFNEQVDYSLVGSAQGQLSCDTENQFGCDGGYVDKAFEYMKANDVFDEGCVPYQGSTDTCDNIKAQSTQCQTNNSKTFSVTDAYYLSDADAMKLDIYLNGPIHATFYMCADLYTYVSGTYSCDAACGSGTGSDSLGAHAVIVTGWGTDEDGVEYWRVQNSWGEEWGDGGYFNMRMGAGALSCRIENWASAALPATEGFSYTVAGSTSAAVRLGQASALTTFVLAATLAAFML